MNSRSRRLLWPSTFNTRDLGGYQVQDGREVTCGQLIRSDNLARLTPAGQDALVEYGVQTIIDLRFSEELKANPSPFTNLDPDNWQPIYQHISLIPEHIRTVSPPLKWKTEGERYSAALEHFPSQIASVIKVMAEASEGSILFFCHAGKDRTGMIAALVLALLGVSHEDIIANYAESAIHLKPWVERLRADIGDDPKQQAQLTKNMAADPETMSAMLTFLKDQYGGAESYLLQAGVSQNELERIRHKLLTS
ncbi:MAG: tyrosine-protein phosphatase [Chloroflexota bacterium]